MKRKIGLTVAIEMDAIFNVYPNHKKLESPKGFEVYFIEEDNYDLYVIKNGMGTIAAAAGVQYLITKYNVEFIFNYGVVGGLTLDMKQQKICLVERVVHYKYDCSEFLPLAIGQVEGHDSIFLPCDKDLISKVKAIMSDLKLVTCCSGDKFISTATEKEYLHNTFEGDICDMESSGIILTCELNNVPCLLLKAVSDGLADGAEGFFNELQNASLKCLKVAKEIMENLK